MNNQIIPNFKVYVSLKTPIVGIIITISFAIVFHFAKQIHSLIQEWDEIGCNY